MYQGNNPTALASQKLLLDALKKLLKKKSFKDISVSELCNISGVSRQTFYSLFETKENILQFYFDRLDMTKPENANKPSLSLKEVCDSYARYIAENYDTLVMLIDNSALRVFYRNIYNNFISDTKSLYIDDIKDRDYVAEFLASGLSRLAEKYISEHIKPNREELSKLAYLSMSGSVFK